MTTKKYIRKKSKRKSKTKSKNKCYQYHKKKSPVCNKYKNCVWIPSVGCRPTTAKKKVLNQVRKYEYEKKKIRKSNQKNKQNKTKKIKSLRKKRVSKKKYNVKQTKQIYNNIKINHENKQNLENILNKKKPETIKISSEVKWDSKNKKSIISNYNIPLQKDLITLDKKRKIVILNKKALNYFYSLVRYSDVEIGGELDFNLDDLFERSTTFLGKVNSVNIQIPDYEVPYHTHPFTLIEKNNKIIFDTPSVGTEQNPGDLYVYFINTVYSSSPYLQQCNIVFASDGIYVWYYSKQLYDMFKKYKNNINTFKKQFFLLYNTHISEYLHYSRLISPLYNNYWIKQLEHMGIFMFKFVDKKYTYNLNWNILWDINDVKVSDSIKNIEKYTLPAIRKGTNVYPSSIPLYIRPVEPLKKLN